MHVPFMSLNVPHGGPSAGVFDLLRTRLNLSMCISMHVKESIARKFLGKRKRNMYGHTAKLSFLLKKGFFFLTTLE